MKTLSSVVLTVFLCSLVPLQASAQDDVRERARQLYNDAAECYDLGRYQCALENWQEVYSLTEVPSVLYNLGNTHERLGNLELALERLEEFRPYAPPAQTEVLDSRIANLRERVALREEAAQAEEAERIRIEQEIAEREAAARQLEEERERLEAERARLAEDLERAEREAAAASYEAPLGLKIARWSTLGLGVAGVATGVGFQIRRASLKSDLENNCSDGVCPFDQGDTFDSYEGAKTGAIVGYSIGAAFLATSLVTFIIQPGSDSRDDATEARFDFAPSFYAGGGGFQLRGTF